MGARDFHFHSSDGVELAGTAWGWEGHHRGTITCLCSPGLLGSPPSRGTSCKRSRIVLRTQVVKYLPCLSTQVCSRLCLSFLSILHIIIRNHASCLQLLEYTQGGSTEKNVLTMSRLFFSSFQEYESLEQENTSLKREIGKLTDEMKHLSEVLKDHEKICPLLHCTMNFVTVPRPDALSSCLPR